MKGRPRHTFLTLLLCRRVLYQTRKTVATFLMTTFLNRNQVALPGARQAHQEQTMGNLLLAKTPTKTSIKEGNLMLCVCVTVIMQKLFSFPFRRSEQQRLGHERGRLSLLTFLRLRPDGRRRHDGQGQRLVNSPGASDLFHRFRETERGGLGRVREDRQPKCRRLPWKNQLPRIRSTEGSSRKIYINL